jgi:hypothetical protein
VNIRFTSSLTPEDENRIVPALLNAICGFLDLLPVAYVIRVDAADSRVYQRCSPQAAAFPHEAEAAPTRPHAVDRTEPLQHAELSVRQIRLADS